MKKIHILGLALFAMFAFSALAAASASAEVCLLDNELALAATEKWTTEPLCEAMGASEAAGEWLLVPEWLVEGAAIPAGTSFAAETEGGIILQVLASAGGTVLNAVLCSGTFDGFLYPKGLDEVTAVLNLAKELIGTLSGLTIDCEVVESAGGFGDCAVGTLAEVWPENLPWHTQLSLMASPEPEFLDHFLAETGKVPAWEVICTAGLLSVEVLCEGLVTAAMENDATTTPASVLGEFLGTEEAKCEGPVTGLTGTVLSEGTEMGQTWALEAVTGKKLLTAMS